MNIFEELKLGVESTSAEDTERVGQRLGEAISGDCFIALSGDLGTGKTAFVRGLAVGLGITDAITSPTFNIYLIYNGAWQLVHVDAYRLQGPEAMDTLMLEEFLTSPYVVAVEWADRIADWLPEDTLHLVLTSQDENRRHLILVDGHPT